jgi:phenylalanyl-tRNA synthetase beta chain
MLCSARELKLSEDHGGLLELAADAPIGQNIRDYLGLDDTLITLKLTPNLAHCLSVFGIARELSALTGSPLRIPEFPSIAATHDQRLPVTVVAPDLCGRFSGRVIRNVNPRAATPQWMVDRLARCGQRPVSPLVDISNYVMFELGRPSHIFDLDKIQGGLEVRWGRSGESLKLLNGNTISVDEQVGVIADAQQVESLAGIMGGDATAVSDDTQNIYVEAAFWWPKAVAGRSRRYNFSTDAGHRFERGVDPEQTVEHIERITRLLLDICGGEVGPVDDQRVNLPEPAPVVLRVARAEKVIGMPLTQERCSLALRRLGLSVAEGDGILTVLPPSYRFDLVIEEDLIEEVVRMVGYNNLPTTPPLAPITPKLRAEAQRSPFAVRRQLATLGYQETINFSFVDESWEHELAGNANPIKLLNPIASQMSVMRSSLIGSLLQVLKFNVDRKASRLRVFEIGRAFMRDAATTDSITSVAGFDQPMKVAGLAWGSHVDLQWGQTDRSVDFYDVKGEIQALFAPLSIEFEASEHAALHPGRSAGIRMGGRLIGHMGELHPRWRQKWGFSTSPIVFELSLDAVLHREVARFEPVSRHQAVVRDIAVVVAEGVSYASVEKAVMSAPTQGLLREVRLFDLYRPKVVKGAELQAHAPVSVDEKSLALRLTIHGGDESLKEEQIDMVVQSVIHRLGADVGARLRA